MTRRMKLMIAAGLGLALLAGGTAYAYTMQADAASSLRASGGVLVFRVKERSGAGGLSLPL